MTTKSSAAVLLNDQREVLLIQRNDARFWTLPTGKVEQGETLEQAAIRETLEETGYLVIMDRLVGEYWRPQYPGGGDMLSVFSGRVVGYKPDVKDSEARKVQWFALDKMPSKLYPFTSVHIQDAFLESGAPVNRVQRLPFMDK